jgi:predicted GH43/DUF377 family glycosyl hydrolase
MFKWKKLGNVFNPKLINDGYKREWMNAYSQCTSAIIFDNFVRVFFSCRPEKDKNNQFISNIAFVDLDKKDITKVINIAKQPLMPLGELGTFDEFAIYPISVIEHENKLLLYYAGWMRCQSIPYTVSIGLAKSNNNGLSFTRYSKGPILTNSPQEPFELSGPKVRKYNDKWFMYYLAGEKWVMKEEKAESVYKIRLAISEDGINWIKLNENIINTVLPEDECQAGPDVFYYNNKYHMFFSYRYAHNFKNRERGYKIGYAYSIDAINWIRNDSLTGIGLSEIGWDSQMMHYPHILNLDDKLYMLYNGNNFGEEGFGIAILEN